MNYTNETYAKFCFTLATNKNYLCILELFKNASYNYHYRRFNNFNKAYSNKFYAIFLLFRSIEIKNNSINNLI